MIHSMMVENIALIDKLNIDFSEGLNVLSGETGAGKSIIIGSMNLILGERADKEMIRSGQEYARVEAVFYLDVREYGDIFARFGIEPEEELIVSRELSITGRNVCRINGATVNLSILKSFMTNVVDLHGQHEHQFLLFAQNHLGMIDSYSGAEADKVKEQVSLAYKELRKKEGELAALGGDERERKQTIDFLQYRIEELFRAKLKNGEGDELKKERELLANAQGIMDALGNSYSMLYSGEQGGSVLGALKKCVDELARIEGYSADYAQLQERLNDCYYTLEETAHDINSLMGGVHFDEQRQNEVEERIESINALKRKYGAADEDELIHIMEEEQEKLDKLVNSVALSEKLLNEIGDIKDKLYKLYEKLSGLRRKTAKELTGKITGELKELGMESAVLEARFDELAPAAEAAYTKNGLDKVEFYISTNAGEPPKPLSKTASGGEISRIMLAFKNVFSETDHVSTMIFDEIDTGISGRMAHVVAEKMAAISRYRQIICVTHLPQIVAMADRNFLISKKEMKNKTVTTIERLDETEAMNEIARLSGGIETDNAKAYAREMAENARRIKKKLNQKIRGKDDVEQDHDGKKLY